MRSLARALARARTVLIGAGMATLLASVAVAQGGLDLSWYTVDGGGARSSGGGFALEGSIGQPDAGALSGGSFTLQGGFWISDSTPTPTVSLTVTLTPTATLTGTPPTATPSPTSTLSPPLTGMPPTTTATVTATATPTATPSPAALASPQAGAAHEGQEHADDRRERRESARLTEEARQQRERTNRAGPDDYRIEGDVLAVACDAPAPAVIVANRDGSVTVELAGQAATLCGVVHPGDYVEAEGEKQTEAYFLATEVTITRNGRRIR